MRGCLKSPICFPWLHVWVCLSWLLTGLLYSGLLFWEQRPQCSQTLTAKLGECHIFGQVAVGTLSGLGIWVEVLKVTSWTQQRRAYKSTESNPLVPSWPWDRVKLSDLTTQGKGKTRTQISSCHHRLLKVESWNSHWIVHGLNVLWSPMVTPCLIKAERQLITDPISFFFPADSFILLMFFIVKVT